MHAFARVVSLHYHVAFHQCSLFGFQGAKRLLTEPPGKTGAQALGAFRWFSSGLLKIVRGEVEGGKAVREHADRPKQSISQFLVGSSGLEPPTSRLSGARSNHLSYEPVFAMTVDS